METMSDKVLAIYCFLDDFLRETNRKAENKSYRCSDGLVLTTAVVAARFFYGNQAAAMRYMAEQQGVVLLEKSAFNRRLHKLADTLEVLFYYLARFFKDLNVDKTYVIDSFPVPVCDNIRIRHSRLVKGEHYRGKIASKRRFFYGFRVQVITTAHGEPVQYLIHPGAFVDVTALQAMDVDLPCGSELFGDSGYTDYEQEDYYAECEAIVLRMQRKKGSRRPDAPYWVYLKKQIRQKIEQAFSQITARFPKHIHAVTQHGFVLKIILFLLAHSFEKGL